MSEKAILIADSDSAFTDTLSCFLQENGLNPTAMPDMDSALSAIVTGAYDIAVIEFCNPRYREQVTSAVAHRSNDTAVILTCSCHSREAELAARSLSPAFYFVKPIEPNDLLAVILRISEMQDRRRILALRRMERREGVRHE
jgi:DNA-binding NtrC family response regulator